MLLASPWILSDGGREANARLRHTDAVGLCRGLPDKSRVYPNGTKWKR